MTDKTAAKIAELAARPGAQVRRGVFVGLNADFMALVDLGDSRFPCAFGAGIIPEINETVQVLSIGSQHLVFPLAGKPGEGTVVLVASPMVTVQTSIGDVIMPYVGTAPSSGNRVAIGWSEGPRCLGVLSTTVTPPDPPPAPGGGGALRTVTFRAIAAGSTDRGAPRWWSPNPQAGNSTYGAWFHGTAIKDTIPADAVFEGLQFKVNRIQDQGGQPRFTLHSDPYRAGVPAMSAYTEWDPPGGWQTPPDPEGWFNELKAGGSRFGVGLNQGGYNIFASLAQDSESGALRISWRD